MTLNIITPEEQVANTMSLPEYTSPPFSPTYSPAPTIISSDQTDKINKVNDYLSQPKGNYLDAAGNVLAADGSLIKRYDPDDQSGTTSPTGKDVFGDPTGYPSGITSAEPTKPLTPLEQELENSKKNQLANEKLLDDLRAQASAASIGLINSIHAQYSSLITQQRQANESLQQARERSLLMGGSARYAQLSSEGLLNTQFSYGLSQIADLQARENKLVAEAQLAQTNKDFEIASKKIEMAQSYEKQRFDAMSKMADDLAETSKTVRKEKRIADIDIGVAEALKGGVSDPLAILIALKKKGLTASAKEVSDALTNLGPDAETLKQIGQINMGLAKTGAPQEVKDAVNSATTVTGAFKAAGDWLQEGSGTVGEWLALNRDRSKQGKAAIDFDAYATADANRKARIAASQQVLASGMTPKQEATFNSMADKLRKSPLIMAEGRALILKDIANEIKKDPTNGPLQLSMIYSYIQALDTYQSAVREGEVGFVQELLNIKGKLDIWKSNLEEDKIILDEKTAKDIAKNAEMLISTIEKGAQMSKNEFAAQANRNKFKPQWDEFRAEVDDLNKTSLGSDAEIIETNAESKIQQYGQDNPDKREQITQMLEEYSYEEIIQILGL